MNKNIGLLVVVLFVAYFSGICGADDLCWENISREVTNVNTVWVDPDDPRIIYIGTDKGIIKSNDAGENWSIMARQKKPEKGYYRALVQLPNRDLCLGTSEGVLISKDDGRSWNKIGGVLGHLPIEAITSDKSGKIYILSEGKVFKADPGTEAYEKIAWKGYSRSDKPAEGEEIDEQSDEPRVIHGLRYISIDPARPGHIYLIVDSSVLESEDDGRSWVTFPGLPDSGLRRISVSAASRIYGASDSRLYVYDSGAWRELGTRMAANDIHALAIDKRENVYLATEEGLFKSKAAAGCRSKVKKEGIEDKTEPTIQQVHIAAIEHADVNIEKIREWRKKAAKRALLPKLEVSFDRDTDSTIYSNTWGIYGNGTTPGRHYVGPDDRTNYRNNNYSVSLSWELGDLIWSDAQTSIDVRSRLMVELRNDILDEITRIYFERRRLKAELNNLVSSDNKITEKRIRVQELTALLDGFTGGYFSRQSK
ncbi:MAG: hypothetical protein WC486_02820 [Candidatus Omnitrophota bacterium]